MKQWLTLLAVAAAVTIGAFAIASCATTGGPRPDHAPAKHHEPGSEPKHEPGSEPKHEPGSEPKHEPGSATR